MLPLRNRILRHPSNVDGSRGFLGLNRRWNSRPASWAGQLPDGNVTAAAGRSADLSSVSFFFFDESIFLWYVVLSANKKTHDSGV